MKPDATDKPSFIGSVIRRLLGSSTSSTSSTAANKKKAGNINPADAWRRIEEGTAILIDVREPAEHAREKIPGARLVPLSRFESHDFSADCAKKDVAIFHCHSGARTAMNAKRFMRSGFRDVFVLSGGIIAWKRAGLPTKGR